MSYVFLDLKNITPWYVHESMRVSMDRGGGAGAGGGGGVGGGVVSS